MKAQWVDRLFITMLVALFAIIIYGSAHAATQNAVLTWTARPAAENITSYIVEQRTCGTGTYTQLGTTLPAVTTFTHQNLAQGVNNGYRVTAINALGPSPTPSDEVCITSAGQAGKVGGLNVIIQLGP